jgi:hypothetical protein
MFRTLIHGLEPPVSVRCILSANETNATFRFHQVRPGERAHHPDLDGYRLEKMIVIDVRPS